LQQLGGGGGGGGGAARLQRLQRIKVRVSRTGVLASAQRVFWLDGVTSSILEVEFMGEEGSGTGPTLEFYSLLSHDFAQACHGLWRGPAGEGGAVEAPHGLFPAALPPHAGEESGAVRAAIERFELFGRTCGKALQDGRLLDLALSPALYRAAFLGQPLGWADLVQIDPGLSASAGQLAALAKEAEALLADGGAEAKASLEALSLRGARLDALGLTFTLPGGGPGGADVELLPGGAVMEVTPARLPQYARALLDALAGAGVARQLAAMRRGIAAVLPLTAFVPFSPGEVEALLCGARERWSPDMLADACRFDHGYTAASPPVRALLAVLSELDAAQQCDFLRFVTGAPRLPPGGLARLQPRLTIVCKHPSGGGGGAGGSAQEARALAALGTTAADGCVFAAPAGAASPRLSRALRASDSGRRSRLQGPAQRNDVRQLPEDAAV